MHVDAKRLILTRSLPKTGQTYKYRTGDDGDYEAGWWKGLKIATNRGRLIAKTISSDDVVIDRATGLMWAADGNASGCNDGNVIAWNDAIDYANSLTFAGFTDWRLPNIIELISIIDYASYNPSISEPPFSNTPNERYWAATTYRIATVMGWTVIFDTGWSSNHLKSASARIRCVRGGL